MPTVKTIIVDKVTEKESKSGNTYLDITDTEGKSHRLFDDLKEKWSLAEAGKTLKLTKEQRGKYWNVLDVEIGEIKDVQVQNESWNGDSPEKRASIERQKFGDITKDLLIAGILTLDTLEGLGLREAIRKNLPVSSVGETTQKSDTPTQKTELKPTKKEEPANDEFLGPEPVNPITQEQIEALAVYQKKGIHLLSLADKEWRIESARDLTEDQANRLLDECEAIMKSKEPGLAAEAKAAAKRG